MTEVHLAQQLITNQHDHHHTNHHAAVGLWHTVASALHLPGYTHAHERPPADDPLYANALGIRTVKWAFAILGVTTLVQTAIYLNSGSVSLLADTMHNLADTLNSLPLWIAFALMRRPASRRYTYGYGRAEDLAGLFIVGSILFSAFYSFWESFQKLINPQPITHWGWVIAASLVGFAGNEAVGLLQIRVGRRIGSEAMVADGRHAQTDSLTSLAVIIAMIGAALGIPILDPILGLIMGVAILFITRDTIIAVWYRLMDAVDPALLDTVDRVLVAHPEIKQVVRLQMRWIGHRLHADMIVALDDALPLTAAEEITDHIRHHLFHDLPYLSDALISAVPWKRTQLL